ncbi:peptidase C39 family protein [Schaalia sp. ZJ1691]|uniref:peptidase C39 family protein n=1 Tax=Schaalia sp. ZJ1691 TaxID=2709404 RepID=UPI0013E9CB87|nr:peptidase C39 family protein [Schaalia sp. ZJ1691]
MTVTITTLTPPPGDSLCSELLGVGVPQSSAELWSCVAGLEECSLYVARDDADPRVCVLMWEVHRRAASQRRIADWTIADGGAHIDPAQLRIILDALVDAVIAQARQAGSVLVKAQTRGDDDALEDTLISRGFGKLDTPSGGVSFDAPEQFNFHEISGWVRRADGGALDVTTSPRYERQKTEFTCGPAAGIMALDAQGHQPTDGIDAELSIWREATYFGGSDHFGLALSLADRGARVDVLADVAGPLIGMSGSCALIPGSQRQYIFNDHHKRALNAGVTERIGEFSLVDIDRALDDGQVVVLLVDLHDITGEDVPHWILVWGRTEGAYLVHDPWSDEAWGESWVETHTVAVEPQVLWNVAQWSEGEREPHRAALLVG